MLVAGQGVPGARLLEIRKALRLADVVPSSCDENGSFRIKYRLRSGTGVCSHNMVIWGNKFSYVLNRAIQLTFAVKQPVYSRDNNLPPANKPKKAEASAARGRCESLHS